GRLGETARTHGRECTRLRQIVAPRGRIEKRRGRPEPCGLLLDLVMKSPTALAASKMGRPDGALLIRCLAVQNTDDVPFVEMPRCCRLHAHSRAPGVSVNSLDSFCNARAIMRPTDLVVVPTAFAISSWENPSS